MGNIDNCIDFNQKHLIDDDKRQQNIVSNAPTTKYALRMKNNFPPLPQHIEKIRNINQISQLTDITKDSPVYFIYQKYSLYQGHWKQGLPHGYGKILYSDFSYYEGLLVQGQPNTFITKNHHEEALFIYKEGSYYIGQFKNSFFQGKGKLISKNNEHKIVGNFHLGLPHGKVTEMFTDTNQKYQGLFVNGVKQGQGKYYKNDRLIYDGNFKNGNFHGDGRLIDQNGNQFIGVFQDGKKIQGQFIGFMGNIRGQFNTDNEQGQGFYEWRDGKFYLGQFQNQVFHGKGVIYHQNGRVIEGIWKKGTNVQITKLYNIEQKQVSKLKEKYKSSFNAINYRSAPKLHIQQTMQRQSSNINELQNI